MPYKIQKTCEEIAHLVEGELIGNGKTIISGLNRIEYADNGDLTFYNDTKFEEFFKKSNASCILVQDKLFNELETNPNTVYIKVDNPYKKFIVILNKINEENQSIQYGIHPTAIIDSTAEISKKSYIGPNCIIGKNSKISDGVVLHSNVCLYDDVTIGEGTYVHSGVTLCFDTKIGKNCIIQPGAVIGADGFGFIENPDGSYTKIPQLGNVIIGDDVEIGANATIDRAIVGSTIIGNGVKIDNLVHIAHNAEIGENTAMAAQVGISGSTKIGKRNRFGGQVGIAGHLHTVDDVAIQAQSGVAKSVLKPGIYFGSPIKERIKAFRIEAALHQLPEIITEFRNLVKKLEKIPGFKD
ncbi:MAG: UDP-3-O-(3-hydroxymyristoyl)glucosamine N-acyltransferase [Candidatus Kapabacteria bacterium]|nr:UDP-3-O-(3-hydroxymyristoyl)glucosamine N-acyltransferase [Candidatus Kapabacteria bacterium]